MPETVKVTSASGQTTEVEKATIGAPAPNARNTVYTIASKPAPRKQWSFWTKATITVLSGMLVYQVSNVIPNDDSIMILAWCLFYAIGFVVLAVWSVR